MRRLPPALFAVAVVAPVLWAVPARADDASYLQKLRTSGAQIPTPDDVRLTTGRYICGQLRVYTPGYDVRRVLANTFFLDPEAAQAHLEAAQSELCPDTLGHPVPDLPA